MFCPLRYYVIFGALASAALIGLAAPATAVVIAAITLLFVYPLHRLMRYGEAHEWPEPIQRMLLPAGMTVLVGFLLLFKVYRYFTVPWLGGPWLSANFLALIGFSYFIFRAISFLHLQSILKKEPATPLTLLYYTLFPPTITSGPIQKYPDFRQQIEAPLPIDVALLKTTAYRVTRGYFRKLVVAGLLNGAVQSLLTVAQPTIWISSLTILLLYLFFYFDFAGYSDIAIGFGLLLGIKVPENFRKPFEATTVSEFWRNYHITLVDWFRDQVFIPLGGMKGSQAESCVSGRSGDGAMRILAWTDAQFRRLGTLARKHAPHGSTHGDEAGPAVVAAWPLLLVPRLVDKRARCPRGGFLSPRCGGNRPVA